ncbi:MAG: biosynthetic-type acetolactate synthase large subunit [Firmicutes bacterium]|nr:biosynthetic-type acetolactate synthase large subunit [Bacillota bacterium]MCM1400712.1 biosynthetic-type acetolactate synthase large subunit [Bacteroides sp.]MCM1476406.1 biosynthetic-type acetolactate synthase large subunit [Bacteroides sp.]
MSEMITGATALIQGLLAEGVDRIFGYPGGYIIPVFDTLYDYTDRITNVLTRHEQGAMHAAQGYARTSHKPGVVIVTSGPAATNLITGLSDAMMDSTPLVVITGQAPSAMLGTDAFQETDVMGITQPITKWSYQIRHASEVSQAVARAFHIASTGRPGPVVLDFTKDAQIELTEAGYKPCNFIRSYVSRPEMNPYDVKRLADMINRSRRPLILAGQGITIAEAEEELRLLAEKADIPVAATLLGLSTLPSDHHLFKGMLGMHGNFGPNINTNRADLIVAVGMRFDDRVTGVLEHYAPQARIAHIDIDEAEFNKNVHVDLKVHADAKEALSALLPLINKAAHNEWVKSFDRHNEAERRLVIEEAIHGTDPGKPATMGEVARLVSEAASPGAVLVTDVGQNQMLSARYFRFTAPRSIITSGGLGTMGFGLPAAIGAKMGAPEREVYLFTGDGGLQMTIQELGTIMQYDTPVKIVLLNNNYLGNVRQWQQLFFNGRFSMTQMLNPDFRTLASAYGIEAIDVTTRAELPAAVERLVASQHAMLLNVNVLETDMVFPMTPVGAAVDHIMINPTDIYQPEE